MRKYKSGIKRILFSNVEVAKCFNYSPSTIYYHAKKHKIGRVIGGKLLFTKSERELLRYYLVLK